VHERGDRYMTEVDPADQPDLYRCASLRAAGVPVAGSSDAPYASADLWAAMDAAVERRTLAGRELGHGERVDARTALEMYVGDPRAPGGPARRVAVGAAADLCLLHAPLREALQARRSDLVRATFVAGRLAT